LYGLNSCGQQKSRFCSQVDAHAEAKRPRWMEPVGVLSGEDGWKGFRGETGVRYFAGMRVVRLAGRVWACDWDRAGQITARKGGVQTHLLLAQRTMVGRFDVG
jgi:hypothetical protein